MMSSSMNHAERLGRRTFLRQAGIGIGGLTIAWLLGEIKTVAAEEPAETVRFPAARDIALRTDRIHDRMPDLGIEINIKTLHDWVDEVIPFFEENKIVTTARYPEEIFFERFKDGFKAMHVLGTSDCDKTLTINGRLNNPLSVWYGDLDFWGTVVHELAHEQQGPDMCKDYSIRRDLEVGAQVAMLEVLASMAMGGSKIAAFSFVHELRDIAFGAAWVYKMKHKAEFNALAATMFSTPLDQAEWQRIQNAWKGREWRLIDILLTYNFLPFDKIMMAHKNNHDIVTGAALPNSTFPVDDFGYLIEMNRLERIINQHIGKK